MNRTHSPSPRNCDAKDAPWAVIELAILVLFLNWSQTAEPLSWSHVLSVLKWGGIIVGSGIVLLILAALAIALAPSPKLAVCNAGIRKTRCGFTVDAIAWADLAKITVMFFDEGPLGWDIFCEVAFDSVDGRRFTVSYDAASKSASVTRLQRLPGFDYGRFSNALSPDSTDDFICWEGRPGEGLAAAGQG